jgi:hypothetical protein
MAIFAGHVKGSVNVKAVSVACVKHCNILLF